MKMNYFEFYNPVKILSGVNALEHIPYELNNLGVKNPAVLTDKTLRKLGQVDLVLNVLKEWNLEVSLIVDEIPVDSSVEVVNNIAKQYKENSCDSIIAIGGGSVIDTAKGVNLVVSKGAENLLDYMGVNAIKGKLNQLIVVPSTAGTGSEATLVSVIANFEKQIKMEYISYNLVPDVAVLDPKMTISLPKKITASTAVDALTHSIEAYTCLQKNPISDAYSTASIKMIIDNVNKVIKNGKDEQARLAMATASFMAGVAFSNSMVGIIHAIGHALGSVSHVPHGDAMAILLIPCMEFNKAKISHYYGELLLYVGGPEIYANIPVEERGNKTIELIGLLLEDLNKNANLPITLREAGVKKDDFSRIAEVAINDGATITNPVEVSYDAVMKILNAAY